MNACLFSVYGIGEVYDRCSFESVIGERKRRRKSYVQKVHIVCLKNGRQMLIDYSIHEANSTMIRRDDSDRLHDEEG